jgi:hypothetical protein
MIFGDDSRNVVQLLEGRRRWLTPRMTFWICFVAFAVMMGGFLMHPVGQRTAAGVGRRVRATLGMTKADLGAARRRLEANIGMAGDPWSQGSRIVVRKGDRELDLFSGATLLKTYPIALGTHPDGQKERRGDGSTPEGEYVICTRLPRSQYHLFMGLNYPNSEDAERGMAAGTIDEIQARAIGSSSDRGAQPPWETELGGAIGLHGGGAERDWTLGCIALENEAIEELWVATREGTRVTIRP